MDAKTGHSMPDSRGTDFVSLHQPTDCEICAAVGSEVSHLIDLLDIFMPTRTIPLFTIGDRNFSCCSDFRVRVNKSDRASPRARAH
jgi:hypothetical protein